MGSRAPDMSQGEGKGRGAKKGTMQKVRQGGRGEGDN